MTAREELSSGNLSIVMRMYCMIAIGAIFGAIAWWISHNWLLVILVALGFAAYSDGVIHNVRVNPPPSRFWWMTFRMFRTLLGAILFGLALILVGALFSTVFSASFEGGILPPLHQTILKIAIWIMALIGPGFFVMISALYLWNSIRLWWIPQPERI